MKLLVLTLSMVLCAGMAPAQMPPAAPPVREDPEVEVAPPVPVEGESVFDMASIETPPEFPGGEAALMKYVSDHVRYPQEALEAGIQGKVFMEFIVQESGEVGDVTVKRSANDLLDQEALRVVRTLPSFKPGLMNGKPVRVRYVLPIVFKLT